MKCGAFVNEFDCFELSAEVFCTVTDFMYSQFTNLL